MKRLFPLLVALGLSPAAADPVVVFAAASLKEPVDALAARHGDTVVSYGGSGALARQILQGAPADVVILAHPVWMDTLDDAGVLHPGTRTEIAGNTLVLAGPAGTPPQPLTASAFAPLLSDGRLAIGFTNAVPAGQYGKAALQHLGLWDIAAPRLAEVDNVRAALVLVARKEVPLGIVYATDAQASDAVDVVATFPADSHPPIRYPAATLSDDPAAARFLALAQSADGQALFAAAGFTP